MCDPMTAMVVISAASAGLAVKGQQDTAKASVKSYEDSARLQNETVAKQYDQLQKKGTEEVSQVARNSMMEQARMRVAAGESGISGATVDAALGNSMFNAAEAVSGIQRNTRMARDQAYLDGRGNVSQLKSRANSIESPNWIGAGLQIANTYYGTKAKQGSGMQTQSASPV